MYVCMYVCIYVMYIYTQASAHKHTHMYILRCQLPCLCIMLRALFTSYACFQLQIPSKKAKKLLRLPLIILEKLVSVNVLLRLSLIILEELVSVIVLLRVPLIILEELVSVNVFASICYVYVLFSCTIIGFPFS